MPVAGHELRRPGSARNLPAMPFEVPRVGPNIAGVSRRDRLLAVRSESHSDQACSTAPCGSRQPSITPFLFSFNALLSASDRINLACSAWPRILRYRGGTNIRNLLKETPRFLKNEVSLGKYPVLARQGQLFC